MSNPTDPYVYDLKPGDELIFVRRHAEAAVLYERARDGAVLRLGGPGGPEVATVTSIALRPTKRPSTKQCVLRVDSLITIEAEAEDDAAVWDVDDDAEPAEYRVVTYAPGDHTVAEVQADVASGDLDMVLHALLGIEVAGQDRKGVREAITQRLAQLEAAEE